LTLLRIAIDNREAASGIPELLQKKGLYVQMKNLDVGDYIVAECAVERKTVHDFITSLYGGRLFEQAQRISRSYKNYLLVVEGDFQEALADLRNPRVYWGTLLALALNLEFKVFFTLDGEQTADLLYVLASKTRRKGIAGRPLLVKKPRMATTKDWQLSLLESLPSIGPKLAEKLLTSFGSVRNVVRASRNELAVKGGIGYARAGKIQELLDAEYRRSAARQTRLA
jgi:DNA excision repair protein ERCC-4